MQENRYQNKILTIPNVLSFFRLCLIPVIVWLYIGKQDYFWTLMILILSGATDIIDGIIARKCNMISDFGKAFDPIADKLTQAAMLACLVLRFNYMLIPLGLLVIKEVFTGITALISIKKTDTVKGADWHGKLTTVLLYTTMVLHILWIEIPLIISQILVVVCACVMILSMTLYGIANITSAKKGAIKKHS